MKHLEDWHDVLCKEMDMLYEKGQYDNGGEMTQQHLDTVDKLVHALKSLKTYEAMEDAEYSEGSYYGGGSSYARGRGSNARRDSMGRYSRNDYRSGGYSERGDDGEYEMFRRWMMERGR